MSKNSNSRTQILEDAIKDLTINKHSKVSSDNPRQDMRAFVKMIERRGENIKVSTTPNSVIFTEREI